MSSQRINFTGRKRITANDIAIRLHNEASPLTFEISHLALRRYDFPANALVRIEAYRQATYMPFELGTIEAPILSGALVLAEFNSPDAIRFRLKVTSTTGPTAGQLLAVRDHIRPVWADGGHESLLPISPDPNLEQEVFRLDFNDGPILRINSKITQWRAVSRDVHFMSLVYPEVLRSILTRLLRDEGLPDEEDSNDWRSLWLEFARTHPGIPNPPRDGDNDETSVDDWINEVVAAFCRRNRIFDSFVQRWDSEGNQ